MPRITINNLKVTYHNKKKSEVVALDNFNCDIESDSFNVIVGYSGCGKSTLLRTIAGLIDYEGEIYFDSINTASLTIRERNVALVSQNYALYPHMNIFDNIAFPLSLMQSPKNEIIERVHVVAKYLGIEHCLTRKPRHLSGGQQQKVALARAMVKKPQLYLFDEPLSNFDLPKRYEARMMIRKAVKDYGATAIYVTHDFSEAMSIADNIIVISDGKVEISGKPLDVYNSGNLVVEDLKGTSQNEQLIFE